MTVEDILAELESLRVKWNGHVEYTYSDEPEDWGRAWGIEMGYEYSADELGDLITKIKGEQ